MLMHRKYLLFIDDAPVDPAISHYFDQFDFDILSVNSLDELPHFSNEPEALLINAECLLPDLSKIQLLYHQYSLPILVFSTLKNESICVKMLESGADDYLIKPILPRELHARINAIWRRVQRSKNKNEVEREIYCFAQWRLYPASRKVLDKDNSELSLSAGEYDLLHAFVRQSQQVLDREFLMQITKNCGLNPFDRRIDVQISRLRQKIEVDPKKPVLIKTIRNRGYLFTASVTIHKENDSIH